MRIGLLAALGLLACTDTHRAAGWSEEEKALIASLALPAAPLPSPGNQVADDSAAAALGHRLFFDRGLGRDGQIACATCHRPALHFTDGLRRARGVEIGRRNTPSILGAATFPFLTWDGRKDSLWSQALEPLESPIEQGSDRIRVLRHVAAQYGDEWRAVFGDLPPLDDLPDGLRPGDPAWKALPAHRRQAIDEAFASVGKALAAYQRRLLPQPAPFDRFAAALAAGDESGGGHLAPAAMRGLRIFLGEGRCVLCHGGPLFSDGAFHNLGLPQPAGPGRSQGAAALLADPFRCEGCGELAHLDPALPAFAGAFRTPSLRNVGQTAPYMHAGQLLTLEEVVDFYRFLPGEPADGTRDELLFSISPTLSRSDLVAFLRSLDGPVPDDPWWRPPPDGGQALQTVDAVDPVQ